MTYSQFGGYTKNTSQWLVLAVIIISIGIRLTVYGNLKLSVATRDTASYIASSEVDLLSWKAFTSYRPYTTNLVYKIFTPIDGYRNRAISDGDSGTVKRKRDRGAEDIVFFQSIVSIIGWSCLAWIFSSRLKNGIIKIISVMIIMLFGFTPQIADWDSVLSSESLSISLFIISYAILIWLAFMHHDNATNRAKKILGFIIFLAILFFWIFTRDINTYSLIFLIPFILGLYIIPRFRKTKFLLFASLSTLSLFILGVISAGERSLWKLTLANVWVSDILPFPNNVEYFMDRGMPEYGSPEYSEWFNKDAPAAYMQFLMSHPAYTIYKFFRDLGGAFEENIQPYFKANDLRFRSLLTMIGNYIHPKSGAVFFVTLISLLILWNQFMFQKNQDSLPWIWLMTLAFLSASGTMFFNIFGDSWALARHTLSSTITYRLLMWMLLVILIDFSMVREENKLHGNSLGKK